MNSADYYARFSEDLKLKGYAKRSIQSYLRTIRQVQNFCCSPLDEVSEEQLRQYWLYCKDVLNWGSATLRISYSGIKHFFTFTICRDWAILSEMKFERYEKLPEVLSVDEVRAILRGLPPGQ